MIISLPLKIFDGSGELTPRCVQSAFENLYLARLTSDGQHTGTISHQVEQPSFVTKGWAIEK